MTDDIAIYRILEGTIAIVCADQENIRPEIGKCQPTCDDVDLFVVDDDCLFISDGEQ